MTRQEAAGIEAGFVSPSFDRNVALRDYLTACPAAAVTRGTFLSYLCDYVRQEVGGDPPALYEGVVRRHWLPFQTYPLADFMTLAHNAARLVHPTVHVAEGLRRIGWLSYPSFAATMAGRVVLFAFGERMENVMQAAPHAYRLTLPQASVRVTRQGPAHYLIEFRRAHSFVDTYHVGVVEGAIRAHHLEPEIRVRRGGKPADADFDVRWR